MNLELVEKIGESLEKLYPFGPVLGSIVRTSDLVGVKVSERGFDYVIS